MRRSKFMGVATTARAWVAAALVTAQGVIGVGLVSFGAFQIAGLGWACVVAGGFVLLAAFLGARR
ncbi:MAG: hypothetical protein F2667_04445 [Actinobacteria bacterium]|nr:hypothetical protein [Actinomycetota bacterium]